MSGRRPFGGYPQSSVTDQSNFNVDPTPDPPFRNSGSESSDQNLEIVNPDPGPKWIIPIFRLRFFSPIP